MLVVFVSEFRQQLGELSIEGRPSESFALANGVTILAEIKSFKGLLGPTTRSLVVIWLKL